MNKLKKSGNVALNDGVFSKCIRGQVIAIKFPLRILFVLFVLLFIW